MTINEFGLKDASAMCQPRDINSHKGTYGHGLLIAGSYSMAGAALMAAHACMRSGIGLLTVSTPECNRTILQTTVPEAMVRTNGADCWEFAPDQWKNPIAGISRLLEIHSAIAIGPGIGTSEKTAKALLDFLTAVQDCSEHRPIILDADALNIIASSGRLDLLHGTIITPHPGEFRRLATSSGATGIRLTDDSEQRASLAEEFAVRHGCHVILKGHGTITASPEGQVSINTTGNPGMATGGSGDVLTGILLALAAKGLKPYDAARLSVFIHGLAGDMAANALSQIALTATDIINFLPEAWSKN